MISNENKTFTMWVTHSWMYEYVTPWPLTPDHSPAVWRIFVSSKLSWSIQGTTRGLQRTDINFLWALNNVPDKNKIITGM